MPRLDLLASLSPSAPAKPTPKRVKAEPQDKPAFDALLPDQAQEATGREYKRKPRDLSNSEPRMHVHERRDEVHTRNDERQETQHNESPEAADANEAQAAPKQEKCDCTSDNQDTPKDDSSDNDVSTDASNTDQVTTPAASTEEVQVAQTDEVINATLVTSDAEIALAIPPLDAPQATAQPNAASIDGVDSSKAAIATAIAPSTNIVSGAQTTTAPQSTIDVVGDGQAKATTTPEINKDASAQPALNTEHKSAEVTFGEAIDAATAEADLGIEASVEKKTTASSPEPQNQSQKTEAQTKGTEVVTKPEGVNATEEPQNNRAQVTLPEKAAAVDKKATGIKIEPTPAKPEALQNSISSTPQHASTTAPQTKPSFEVPNTPNAVAQQNTAVAIERLPFEIAASARRGVKEIEIKLDPPELGRIDVSVDVDKNGKVTTHLVVERAETLDQLRRDSQNLERALQNSGLKTDSGSLQFSLRDQSQQNAQQDQQQSPRMRGVAQVELPVLNNWATPTNAWLGADRGSGVDLRV